MDGPGGLPGSGTTSFFVGRVKDQSRAGAACSSCSVQTDCLDFAMADPELQGYWGGTSERERRRGRDGAGRRGSARVTPCDGSQEGAVGVGRLRGYHGDARSTCSHV
ncbi:MAG TPA: WhiB family transcriptional regulator [Acidimicrobiales bacterium]|nr:WhiB family transcriptional regulator [Acidimicrobiales bacterium]